MTDSKPTPEKKAVQKKPTLKIAICGTSQTTRHLAPYDDESWEIWTLGANYKHAPRISRHFEMHDFGEGSQRWSPEYRAWLKDCPVPIYIQAETEHCPSGQVFPIREICAFFQTDYFTCSIAYQIAFALYLKADEIGCYGIDLAQTAEYAWQRPSVEYWIGLARGMGVKVDIPPTSDILKTAQMYAYETHGGSQQSHLQKAIDARQKEIKQRMFDIQQQMAQAQQQSHILAGAEENLRWIRQWMANPTSGALENGNGTNGQSQVPASTPGQAAG